MIHRFLLSLAARRATPKTFWTGPRYRSPHYMDQTDDRYLDMLANDVVWTLNRDDLRKKAQ
jgi:hypothetical protein